MTDESHKDEENLIEKTLEWVNQGRSVAIATVISTLGSSPRPIGSQMVVNDQESFQGSVSGGCIESTVLTEAQFVIRSNEPQRLSIGIDNKKAWDYGLGCGGSIDIYVEPVRPWINIIIKLSKLIDLQHPCCLITNLSTGEKSIVDHGLLKKSSKLDDDIRSATETVISTGHSCLLKKDNVDFFLHGFLPPPKIIIGGAVHIAQPLFRMAQLLGYRPTIIDPRTVYATEKRFPETNLIIDHPQKAIKKIRLHSNSAVVALSHSPSFDDHLLAHALNADVAYIGALGSKKTHADRIRRFLEMGYSNDKLDKIHGPIGLDIGSITPAEIALSIMAEITQKKRKG